MSHSNCNAPLVSSGVNGAVEITFFVLFVFVQLLWFAWLPLSLPVDSGMRTLASSLRASWMSYVKLHWRALYAITRITSARCRQMSFCFNVSSQQVSGRVKLFTALTSKCGPNVAKVSMIIFRSVVLYLNLNYGYFTQSRARGLSFLSDMRYSQVVWK